MGVGERCWNFLSGSSLLRAASIHHGPFTLHTGQLISAYSAPISTAFWEDPHSAVPRSLLRLGYVAPNLPSLPDISRTVSAAN